MATTYDEKELVDSIGGNGIAAQYSEYSVRATKDAYGEDIHDSIASKADKLIPSSANNLAALDTNGQLAEVALTVLNNEITAIGGKGLVGRDNVFVPVKNQTTFEEAVAAIKAGKVLVGTTGELYASGMIIAFCTQSGYAESQGNNSYLLFSMYSGYAQPGNSTAQRLVFNTAKWIKGSHPKWPGTMELIYSTEMQIPVFTTSAANKYLRVAPWSSGQDSTVCKIEAASVREVPSSTSSDEGKVLAVNSSGTAVWTSPNFQDKLVPATGTIESGAVSLQNNKVTSIEIPSDSSATSLTLDCTVAAGECANFACEITNSSPETVTLALTLNSVAGSTHRAAATDGKVESGKFYQLTCAGTCWTLAEFEAPA